jgi:hypothetical protein
MLPSEAKETDTTVTVEDVVRTQREAVEAAELLTELERAAVEAPPDKRPAAAEVTEKRALAEFAHRRVLFTRERAERSRAARRLIALAELGDDIDALAAEASAGSSNIGQATRKVAQAATVLRELCAQHDRQVLALIARAADLACEEPSPVGPKASSAFVARLPGWRRRRDAIQHGNRIVGMIGEEADNAIALAAAGDADTATAAIAAVHEQPAPVRADRYYRAGDHIISESGEQTRGFAQQVRDGRLRLLSEKETISYLDGTLNGD